MRPKTQERVKRRVGCCVFGVAVGFFGRFTYTYRVPPLVAKPTSHKTPHARLFGPSTVHTRCICAAHKRSARLRDTTRCPRSIRDKPSDVLHRVQISISDPSARRAHAGHALPASFTAPWQTLGVVAVRQCTCSCSCEQCALLQRCRQVRYTKPATLRTFEAVELERDRLSAVLSPCTAVRWHA